MEKVKFLGLVVVIFVFMFIIASEADKSIIPPPQEIVDKPSDNCDLAGAALPLETLSNDEDENIDRALSNLVKVSGKTWHLKITVDLPIDGKTHRVYGFRLEAKE